ncbi:hypothetical protein B296_00021773 [Ensete ventricosum]|uniref:Uncharacterized protein n=1 Tax=Ensete ventricosum TaxID=4639 RepID=A0A427AM78_ENSVE|nr:hypothetical protein B296_00021773 [Ensete ventricosum]
MQAVLWHADALKLKSTLEEHTLLITDVRFSPSMPRLATSSFDKTVRVWDVDNVSFKCFTFHAIMQHFLSKNQGLLYRGIPLDMGGMYRSDRGLIWAVHRYTSMYRVSTEALLLSKASYTHLSHIDDELKSFWTCLK